MARKSASLPIMQRMKVGMSVRPLWYGCVLAIAVGRSVHGQLPEVASRDARGRVAGTVFDSLARRPLTGAVVQLRQGDTLSPHARTTTSDSLGRFAFEGVSSGRYTLGFFHALLDSLGVAAPVREISIADDLVRADLAIPGPARFRTAVCGPKLVGDSGAVILGTVRGAGDLAPEENVTVAVQWLEITLSPTGWARRVPRAVMTTRADGWFAFCDVPRGGWIVLNAYRGADSTDLLDMWIPNVIVRRELYLGTPRHLSGSVVRAASGEPLVGALVSVARGPQVRSNAAGEWVLPNAPGGSRMLEVRAVGYYPARRIVDVVEGAPSVRVALSTFAAVLDTVRVRAAALMDPRRTGFQERRRSAMGRYVSAVDIAKRQPRSVSQILRGIPGIRLERFTTYVDTTAIDTTGTGTNPIGFTSDATRILMRATVKDWCFPSFYIDGHLVNSLSAEDIDSWLRPEELAGVEVYSAETVPAQFGLALSNCGSIVIWRK